MRRTLQLSLLINLFGLSLIGFLVYKLGGVSNVVYKLKSKQAISKMEHRNSQFESASNSDSAIVFLGDSITEYGEWSELFPNQKILNRGIAGDGIRGVKQRLQEVARHRPKVIFLMIGVNDLCYHKSGEVIKSYQDLLVAIQKKMPHTEIIVQSILPVNNGIYNVGTTNMEIDKVNATLQQLCLEKSIGYLDIASSFKDEQNNLKHTYTADGIHINGIAYNQWKEKLSDWFPIE